MTKKCPICKSPLPKKGHTDRIIEYVGIFPDTVGIQIDIRPLGENASFPFCSECCIVAANTNITIRKRKEKHPNVMTLKLS